MAGFGDVSEGLAKEFQHMPVAISLAVNNPIKKISTGSGGKVLYFHQFIETEQKLEDIQKKIVQELRHRGWKAFAIPPNSNKVSHRFITRLYPLFPHKTAATCAGLGWIGRNGLLIHEDFGAHLNWATVLTDAPLAVSQQPVTESRCGNCYRCVKACPAKAILGVTWRRSVNPQPLIDTNRCAEQIRANAIDTGYSVCGICALVCRGKGC